MGQVMNWLNGGRPSAGGSTFAPTSPLDPLLLSVLGYQRGSSGRIKPIKGATPLFQTGDIQKALQQFVTQSPGLTAGEQAIPGLSSQILGALPGAQGTLAQAQQYANQLAATGFRTDMAPITAEAMRQFQQQIVPQLAEQYSMQTGIGSSDFFGNLLREGRALETSLGSMQAALDEAAAQRRIQGIPLMSSLATGQLALPVNVGTDLLTLGGGYRSAAEAASPAGRYMNVLGNLGGQINSGQFIQQGFGPSATGQTLASLANMAPNLINTGSSIAGGLSSLGQDAFLSQLGSLPSGTFSGISGGVTGDLLSGLGSIGSTVGGAISGAAGAVGGGLSGLLSSIGSIIGLGAAAA